MIEIPFETCAGCQRCCHGMPGDHIPAKLPPDEPLRYDQDKTPRYDKNHRCERLNPRNHCNLGLRKPIECQLYPIVIFGDDVYVDMACPAWKDAVRQWSERFGGAIDEYDDNKEHKFVKLYLAGMIKDDSKGYHDVDEFYKE